MEKQFIISQSLVSGLLAYLQTRPYQEVAQAIPALMQLRAYDPPKTEEKSEPSSK